MARNPANFYYVDRAGVATWHYVGPGGGIDGSMASGASSWTEYWDMKDVDLPLFIKGCLGYSIAAGQGISRKLPAQHPLLRWLWASKITRIEGLGPTGQRLLKGGVGGQDAYIASWKLLRCTVQYETPPYALIADAAAGAPPVLEWQRFTVPDPAPEAEFIQRQQGQFKWPPGAPSAGAPVRGSLAQVVAKQKLNILWVQVPDVGLYKGGFDLGGSSPNIEAAIGTVNDFFFMGRERGTLLLEGWKPTARTLPVDPTVLGLAANLIPRAWDVMLTFSFFDPPAALLGNQNNHGHNLVPNPANGKWYRVFVQGTPANPTTDTSPFWRYQESDFRKIFQMNV